MGGLYVWLNWTRGRMGRGGKGMDFHKFYIVSIAFSSFSGPGVRWETTAQLSWQLQSHTCSLSTEQEVPLSWEGQGRGDPGGDEILSVTCCMCKWSKMDSRVKIT